MNNKELFNRKTFWENWIKLLKVVTDADKASRNIDITEVDYKPFIETFVKYCNPEDFPDVLNIGAGNGIETRALLKHSYELITALNYNEDIKIKKSIDMISLNADMHNLTMLSRSVLDYDLRFDAIFSLQTFEHALAPLLLIFECRKVLRDGGRIYIDVPDPDDWAMLTTIQHSSVLYARQWISLFKKAGFQLVVDLSVKHRLGFVFEKLPNGEFESWDLIKSYFIEK